MENVAFTVTMVEMTQQGKEKIDREPQTDRYVASANLNLYRTIYDGRFA